MQLRTVPLASWPPLAWLATCAPASDEVTVCVDPGVEVGDDWVCEGVWDAPFEHVRGHAAVKRLGARVDEVLARLSASLAPTAGRAHHQFIHHWAVDRAKERYRDRRPLVGTA